MEKSVEYEKAVDEYNKAKAAVAYALKQNDKELISTAFARLRVRIDLVLQHLSFLK